MLGEKRIRDGIRCLPAGERVGEERGSSTGLPPASSGGWGLTCPEVRRGRVEKKGCAGHHGVMFDCSRNGVLRVDTSQKMYPADGAPRLHRLLLYTEDTYAVEGYPYFGALRGQI